MNNLSITPRSLIKDPGHLLSFGFGSGLAPVAPGTFGTLAAVPFYLLAATVFNPLSYALVTLLVCLLGVYLCGRTTRALGVHDHGAIVWDEFAGLFVTMLFITPSLFTVILGFGLFRLFDIVKPWPISVIDSRVKGGVGVMLDDIIAGVYAGIILHLIVYFFKL